MEPTIVLTAIVIIVVILLLWYCFAKCKIDFDAYLNGFWMAADDKFCEDAGIESMLLFIDNEITSRKEGEDFAQQKKDFASQKGERVGYLIIMNNVTNQPFTLSKLRKITSPDKYSVKMKAQINFEDNQIWDDEVVIDLDIMKGRLVILSADEQKKYAVLHKNHELTNYLC